MQSDVGGGVAGGSGGMAVDAGLADEGVELLAMSMAGKRRVMYVAAE